MIVVLDTNVVIQALNRNHRFAIILDGWFTGSFSWAISTDIFSSIARSLSGHPGLCDGNPWSGCWNSLRFIRIT
jgi:hypothetical protein